MSLQSIIDKAKAASEGVGVLIDLRPNITLVGEGDLDPAKRSASVRLEFYGPDSFEKSRQAHIAMLAVIGS